MRRYRCKVCRRSFRPTANKIAPTGAPAGAPTAAAVRIAAGLPAPAEAPEPVYEFSHREYRDPAYVITSAVSGAPLHRQALDALRAYCAKRGARLIVAPIWYNAGQARRVSAFPVELQDDIFYGRGDLSQGLTYAGDVPVTPTAVTPLSGLQTFGGFGKMDSMIYGHPKIALESVATQPGKFAKLAMTTGAITLPQYTPTKTGKKGEWHHVQGALLVERSGKKFFARQLHSNDDGSFYDLDTLHHSDGRTEFAAIRTLTCGDIHAVRVDEPTFRATFEGPNSIVARLQPERTFVHDLLDFQSQSHHNNRFDRLRLRAAGMSSVYKELLETALVAIRMGVPLDVVDSNHDRHFESWLLSQTASTDDENFELYHETLWQYGRAIRLKEPFRPFKFWMDRLVAQLGGNPGQFTFHDANDAVMVDDIEYGVHGDRGPNGARGSIQAFIKVGAKLSIGHSHSPGIRDGVYQGGTTSRLFMHYNKGLSSWLHAHIVAYKNGKRAILPVLDGQWRAS